MATKAKKQEGNIISRGINFVKDSYEEIKKVHVPTKQETLRATIVVVIMVILFSLFLGLTDLIFGYLIGQALT